jgi:hypothetical protein
MRSTVITVASAPAIIGIGLAVCAAAPLQTGPAGTTAPMKLKPRLN